MKKYFLFIVFVFVTSLVLIGCHHEEVAKEANIPDGCVSWFDGCNNCMVGKNDLLACTRKYCSAEMMEEPKCLKFEE